MEPLTRLIEFGLMAIVAPVWIAAGCADAACHRIQHIERNAGLRESLLHLAMLAELGVAVLAALFLELNAAALGIVLLACIAHEVTMCADLAYAESQRRIPWYEQWVHGLQQAIPWMALGGLVLLNAPQALALVGLGTATAEWSLRPKAEPLPSVYVAGFLAAAALLVLWPFAAETLRCWRQAQGERMAARPQPQRR